jgi:hypothetical protein
MTQKRLPRPRDPVQLGKLIGDILTGQVVDSAPPKFNGGSQLAGVFGILRRRRDEIAQHRLDGRARRCGQATANRPRRGHMPRPATRRGRR